MLQWRRQDFVTGEVRYGSIGGLEYEVPQKLTHLLQCIGNLYLSCDTKKFHDNESTHILHNFWTSTHRGEASPSLAAPLSCLLVWIRRISQIPYRWGPRHTQWCNHSLSQVSSNHRHALARRPIFNLLLFSGLTMVLSTCGQKLWSAPSYRPIFLGCHTGPEGRPKSLFYSRNSRTLYALL